MKYDGRFNQFFALLAYSGSKFNSFTPPFVFYVSSTIERTIGNSVELLYDNKINDFNTIDQLTIVATTKTDQSQLHSYFGNSLMSGRISGYEGI